MASRTEEYLATKQKWDPTAIVLDVHGAAFLYVYVSPATDLQELGEELGRIVDSVP